MIRSPFLSDSRIFILYGMTGDHFCLSDTTIVPLTRYLELHLLHSGFDWVAFYHPHNGARVVGRYSQAEDISATPTRNKPRGNSQLIGGPLGSMDVLEATNPSPDTSTVVDGNRNGEEELRFQRLVDVELPAFLRGRFEDPGRGAFVFEDLDDVIRGFKPEAVRTLEIGLRDLRRSGMNGGRIIFVSQALHASSFTPEAGTGHFLNSLRDEFFDESGNARPNVIPILQPGADEVRNLQRRLRLREKLATRFVELDDQCTKIATELRNQQPSVLSAGLSNVEDRLREHSGVGCDSRPDPLTRLANMLEREHIANQVRADIAFVQNQLKRSTKHQHHTRTPFSVARLSSPTDGPRPKVNLNYAFVGPPGTGKTEAARLIAEAYRDANILPSGHFVEATVKDCVAGYVGQSALKTANLLARALGGVLFIDEVQGFDGDNQFHLEAINTLAKYLEDRRGEVSVIVATYPDKIRAFLELEPGLPSRFLEVNHITFDGYDGTTCAAIFRSMAQASGLEVGLDLDESLDGLFQAWSESDPSFGNGRSVRNLAESMERVALGTGDGVLRREHVPKPYQEYLRRAAERDKNPQEALTKTLAELNGLRGLDSLKSKVKRLVDRRLAAQLRGGDEATRPAGHFTFEGNPGTGKTTVARLLGTILRDLGLLKRGHIVETTRAQLIGAYQGQTARLVREKADEARNGVLFIDEAHNLVQGSNDTYGNEAVGELTAVLENERDSLCVILAGYTDEMARLFTNDPGWASRFEHRIQFEDYSDADCADILRDMARDSNRVIAPELDDALVDLMANLRKVEGAKFSNGRSVRNLFQQMQDRLDGRLVSSNGAVDPKLFVLEDAEPALR